MKHMEPEHRQHDVVVIGGAAAGLAAALQLGRSRRSVVVVDAGAPRNAPAAHMHGYLGHDGRPPAEFLALARAEATGYGARITGGAVTAVAGSLADGFALTLRDGQVLTGRRVLVATGLVDELPDIPGLAAQWGRGVIHCPYCHGWEVRDQRIVVIGTGPLTRHQALLFRQLSTRVTVVVHTDGALDVDDRRRLGARGVRIEAGPVTDVVADGGAVRGVRLTDGRTLEADAVVVGPRFRARVEAVRGLGLAPVPAPMGTGEMLETDARGATTVPGVYAAGNVADVGAQVLGAAAAGARVAAAINADLAIEDANRALARPGDSAADWDQRYAATERWWSGQPNGALVAEAGGLAPGTALDVGCGEGADAIWLARRGWRVTGLDLSAVALDRARKAAAEAGVELQWVRADLVADPPPDRYDLVSVHYPALRHSPGDDAVRALLAAVAPGGRLLVVGHDLTGTDHAAHRGIDPADYLQPADLLAHLDQEWTVEVHETRPRVLPPGSQTLDVPDVVLRARRR